MADVQNLVALRAIAVIISADGTAITTTRGCSAVRTSAGLYTITLDQEVDSTQCAAALTPMTTDNIICRFNHTSDGVKTVVTEVIAGTAADAGFSCIVYAIPPG